MKRYGNLWEKIIDPENIKLAYQKARKCRSKFESVKKFEAKESENLELIRKMLVEKTFKTSKYTTKTIYEPKKRTIYILPFSPDRIVQHSLTNIITPIIDSLFIENSFACRKGKGQHSGSTKTKEFVKHNKYCFKGDISKFYPSINHDILMGLIEHKIKCKDTLWLLRDIVYSFPGETNTPIGNLTSQWFGNLYMHELDMYVKHELKIKNYIRYCDDFCLFHDDKKVLKDAAEKIEEFLKTKLQLKLSQSDLFPTSRGVDFLGYRHFPEYTLLRKSTAKRVKRRLKVLPHRLESEQINIVTYTSTLASAYGWLNWADTYNLMKKLNLLSMLDDAKVKLKEDIIMRDFPKHLNTKQDYLNLLKDFPEQTKKALQGLLENRFEWFVVRKLDEGEVIADSETLKIVESKEGEEVKKYLYEYKEDSNANLFRLGFTIDEVKTLVA